MVAEQIMVDGFLDDPTRVRMRVGDSYFVVDTTSPVAVLIRDIDGEVIASVFPGPHRTGLKGTDTGADRPTGAELIAAERERQEAHESWTAEHDDVHDRGELLRAALCYANAARYGATPGQPPHGWPWEASAWKAESNDPIRSLVKAGALIAAEIDRLQRRAA